jgi:predicted PurR-regulated permease PerM
MMLTVAVPLCIFFWYAGAVVVDQISNLIEQGPRHVDQVSAWLNGTFPKAAALLQQSGFGLGNLNSIYENYSATAMKAGSSVLECVFGIVSLVVTIIFFAYFIMSKELHGKDIVSHLAFLKDDTRGFVAEQIPVCSCIKKFFVTVKTSLAKREGNSAFGIFFFNVF